MSGDVAELRSRIVRAVLLNEHGVCAIPSLKTSTPPLRAEAHWLSVFVPKGTLWETSGAFHLEFPKSPAGTSMWSVPEQFT